MVLNGKRGLTDFGLHEDSLVSFIFLNINLMVFKKKRVLCIYVVKHHSNASHPPTLFSTILQTPFPLYLTPLPSPPLLCFRPLPCYIFTSFPPHRPHLFLSLTIFNFPLLHFGSPPNPPPCYPMPTSHKEGEREGCFFRNSTGVYKSGLVALIHC